MASSESVESLNSLPALLLLLVLTRDEILLFLDLSDFSGFVGELGVEPAGVVAREGCGDEDVDMVSLTFCCPPVAVCAVGLAGETSFDGSTGSAPSVDFPGGGGATMICLAPRISFFGFGILVERRGEAKGDLAGMGFVGEPGAAGFVGEPGAAGLTFRARCAGGGLEGGGGRRGLLASEPVLAIGEPCGGATPARGEAIEAVAGREGTGTSFSLLGSTSTKCSCSGQ
jgi:hypothetical protein